MLSLEAEVKFEENSSVNDKVIRKLELKKSNVPDLSADEVKMNNCKNKVTVKPSGEEKYVTDFNGRVQMFQVQSSSKEDSKRRLSEGVKEKVKSISQGNDVEGFSNEEISMVKSKSKNKVNSQVKLSELSNKEVSVSESKQRSE